VISSQLVCSPAHHTIGQRCASLLGWGPVGTAEQFIVSTNNPFESLANCSLTCVDTGVNPVHGKTSFDNFLLSCLTLFQCLTLEDWASVMIMASHLPCRFPLLTSHSSLPSFPRWLRIDPATTRARFTHTRTHAHTRAHTHSDARAQNFASSG